MVMDTHERFPYRVRMTAKSSQRNEWCELRLEVGVKFTVKIKWFIYIYFRQRLRHRHTRPGIITGFGQALERVHNYQIRIPIWKTHSECTTLRNELIINYAICMRLIKVSPNENIDKCLCRD